MDEHHTTGGADEQFPRTPGPAASTWPGPEPHTDFDDPYGEDPPGPGWRTAPRLPDESVLFAGQAADWEPADGPVTSRTRAWPALPARTRSRPRTSRRPATMLAALVLLGALFGAGIAAISSGQTIQFTPADNPAATSQYTPSAGPVTQPPATASPSPGPASPRATASPSRAPAGDPPAISQAGAAKVLSAFWTQNNQANKDRSGALLSGIEGGTSYAIDAGAYRAGTAVDPANSRYAPIAAAGTAYLIPRLPAGTYPRWFAVRVTYTPASQSRHVIALGYLVFAQPSPEAAWKNVLEPYLLPGAGHGPFIATDPGGYAIPAAADVPGPALQLQPEQAAEQTAASLDGASSLIQDPGNLADMRDHAYLAAHLPAGSAVTGSHTAGGAIYALKTVGGGILAFYSLTAQLSITAPPGEQVRIGIPGYLSPSRPVTSAALSYASQFAAYLPPAGQDVPQLIADASGITG